MQAPLASVLVYSQVPDKEFVQPKTYSNKLKRVLKSVWKCNTSCHPEHILTTSPQKGGYIHTHIHCMYAFGKGNVPVLI